MTWAADARERAEWHRAAVVAAALSGGSPLRFIPERYQPAEEPEAVSEGDNRRGWTLLGRALLGKPPEGW